ncbi:hypothetical protein RYA05_00245 [Pseudomonas syringae pv. actinidiae]|nr:hypothetical protein [Pseudomonas syringae pv. actinidiae]
MSNQDSEIKLILGIAEVARATKSKFVESFTNYRKILSPELNASVAYIDPLDGEIVFSICERKGRFYFRIPARNSLPGTALEINLLLEGSERPYSFSFDSDLVAIQSIIFKDVACLVTAFVEFIMRIAYRDHNPGERWN